MYSARKGGEGVSREGGRGAVLGLVQFSFDTSRVMAVVRAVPSGAAYYDLHAYTTLPYRSYGLYLSLCVDVICPCLYKYLWACLYSTHIHYV